MSDEKPKKKIKKSQKFRLGKNHLKQHTFTTPLDDHIIIFLWILGWFLFVYFCFVCFWILFVWGFYYWFGIFGWLVGSLLWVFCYQLLTFQKTCISTYRCAFHSMIFLDNYFLVLFLILMLTFIIPSYFQSLNFLEDDCFVVWQNISGTWWWLCHSRENSVGH